MCILISFFLFLFCFNISNHLSFSASVTYEQIAGLDFGLM